MRAHIDEPQTGSAAGPTFVVRGWIWLDETQPALAAVEVWGGAALLGETATLHARPDVTNFLGLPAATPTGFAIDRVRGTTLATSTLEVRARLRDGTRTPVLAAVSLATDARPADPLSQLLANVRPDALGLEIGAHALPVPGVTPFYTDTVARYADVDGRADFLADARALPIPTDTLDYLCSSHVLEHLPDPLAALREWHRVLQPGGWLYLVVPDKRYTFDAPRPITSTEHLLGDFLIGATAADSAAHVDEFVLHADWGRLRPECPVAERPAQRAAARERYLADLGRGVPIDIHFHTFTPESLLATLRAGGIVAGGLFEIAAQAERFPVERGDGIGLLLRKRRASGRAARATHLLPHPRGASRPLPLVCPVTLESLQLETAGIVPNLVAARRRRYAFENGLARLLPGADTPPVRPWNSRARRRLTLAATRLRLAFSG